MNHTNLEPYGPYLCLFLSALGRLPVHKGTVWQGVARQVDTERKYNIEGNSCWQQQSGDVELVEWLCSELRQLDPSFHPSMVRQTNNCGEPGTDEFQQNFENTPLLVAAKNGHLPLLLQLLIKDIGCDPHIVQYLVEQAGCDPNTQDVLFGQYIVLLNRPCQL
eukprot:TRINITY_DN62932_c0_g1_i1.p1 TRINITY_DN62932_c0_g1~~TRINITY_DN62932_c0_g1_i1.p1  ORF type:complete len:163 (-),score=12.81 TRINITY_DN62932_c0_g1_i1:210-698(-)